MNPPGCAFIMGLTPHARQMPRGQPRGFRGFSPLFPPRVRRDWRGFPALPRLRRDPDAAAVALHRLLADRQPVAPAARAGVEPLGDAEHPLPEPWLDALAVVADPEQPALRVRPRADLDARGAVRGAVLD